ncbi:MAG: hypothetical protein EOM26_12240 [Alphaproteobacteria bacterium]|nr:hypothetical protein [Alphaproteobacteria bacterium]
MSERTYTKVYPGFCRTYGKARTYSFFAGTTLAANGAIQLFRGVPLGHMMAVLPTSIGAIAAGYVLSLHAFHKANEIMANRKIRLSRGGLYMKFVQAAALSVPVLLTTCYNAQTMPNRCIYPDYYRSRQPERTLVAPRPKTPLPEGDADIPAPSPI